mgnify:CR=1 FL=1
MKTYYFTVTAHSWIHAPDEQDDNEIVDMILEDPLVHIIEDPDIDVNDISVNENGKWKWIMNDKDKLK